MSHPAEPPRGPEDPYASPTAPPTTPLPPPAYQPPPAYPPAPTYPPPPAAYQAPPPGYQSPPPGYPAPPPGYQSPPPTGPPDQPTGYYQGTAGAPGSWGMVSYPESSQATLALILGIAGVVGGLFTGVLGLASPFAWWLGAKEKSAIDAGRRDPANRGQAVGAYVLGIVGTVLLILGALAAIGFIVFFIVVGLTAASTSA